MLKTRYVIDNSEKIVKLRVEEMSSGNICFIAERIEEDGSKESLVIASVSPEGLLTVYTGESRKFGFTIKTVM